MVGKQWLGPTLPCLTLYPKNKINIQIAFVSFPLICNATIILSWFDKQNHTITVTWFDTQNTRQVKEQYSTLTPEILVHFVLLLAFIHIQLRHAVDSSVSTSSSHQVALCNTNQWMHLIYAMRWKVHKLKCRRSKFDHNRFDAEALGESNNLDASSEEPQWASFFLLQSQHPQQFFLSLPFVLYPRSLCFTAWGLTKLKSKCTYFTQGETWSALCYTSIGTVCLLQHHLPRPFYRYIQKIRSVKFIS